MNAPCSHQLIDCCVVQLLAHPHFLGLSKDLRKDFLKQVLRHYDGEDKVPENNHVVPNFYKTIFSHMKLKRHIMAMVLRERERGGEWGGDSSDIDEGWNQTQR